MSFKFAKNLIKVLDNVNRGLIGINRILISNSTLGEVGSNIDTNKIINKNNGDKFEKKEEINLNKQKIDINKEKIELSIDYKIKEKKK